MRALFFLAGRLGFEPRNPRFDKFVGNKFEHLHMRTPSAEEAFADGPNGVERKDGAE